MKESVTRSRKKYLRPLVGSALIGASLFQLALPVLAQTAAGTTISNTATATYEDDDGNPFETISNTVEVTVAEVAGITNIAQPPVDVNAGSVIGGDQIDFPFIITNVGNESTNIFIPSPDDVTVNNLENVQVQIDLDNDGTPDVTLNPGDAGFTTTTPIAPGGFITVTITGTVPLTAGVGDIVNAQLGNTGDNDSDNGEVPETSQNQPDIGTDGDAGVEAEDVRTVDANPGNGAPVNGEREAADTSDDLIVGQAAPQPLALATILKTNGPITLNDPLTAVDDVITYNLELQVAATSPDPDFTAADLEGTQINLDTIPETRILVSDVIPVNTSLTGTPVAPSGWTVVYSIDDPTTTVPIIDQTGTPGALPAADWTITAPADLTTVTRIGFIQDPAGVVAQGATVTGFQFDVVADGVPVTGDDVFNLTQVFGETVGDPNNEVVYDESGDPNPNNFSDNGTPPDTDGTDFDPTDDTGVPDPANDGLDNNNDNTGVDDDPNVGGGEDNVVTLVADPAADILNGPNGQPAAVGANDNNDDFQNQSIPNITAADLDDGDIDAPAAVEFINTTRNNSAVDLDNVVLRPIGSGVADTATGTTGRYVEPNPVENTPGDPSDDLSIIPDGTLVTIDFPNAAAPTQTAQYSYIQGTDTFVLVGGTTLDIDGFTSGTDLDYSVTVQLPNDVPPLQGYSIPIVAYVNNDGNDTFDPGIETTFNIKIDRLYTGFLQLIKTSRILQGTGPAVPADQQVFASTPADTVTGFDPDPATTDVLRTPAPGNIIEYQVQYLNISTVDGTSGNVILNANNVILTENGLGPIGTADWALDQDGNSEIDTSNVVGTAVDSFGGTITFFNGDPAVLGSDISGTTAATDVTQYRDEILLVPPGTNGTFTFQRQIN